jgi:lambda family phage tail tape measure protein
MAQERVEIIFVSKGQRQVERSIKSMAKSAESLNKNVEKATDAINRLGKTRGGTQAASRGVQQVDRDVKRLGNTAKNTGGRVNSLWKSLIVPPATGASLRETNRTLIGLVGTFGAFYTGRVLVGISDEFNRLNNTLKGFGTAAKEIDKVRLAINKVSNEARVDAVQAATLFGRLKQATGGLALSNRELVDIVGTVNKALRLGGATALESSQSIRQLSQAFNKGKLDGDEFRSVMENAPILQELLTKSLGVSKQALISMATQGKITSKELVEAFQKGGDAINERFLNRVDTLGDSLSVLKNSFREAFGSQIKGSVQFLVRAIIGIAQNMDALLSVAVTFAGLKMFDLVLRGSLLFLARLKAIKAALLSVSAMNLSGMLGTLGPGGGRGYTRQSMGAAQKAKGATLANAPPAKMGMIAMGTKGALRALPYVGWALIIADMIPVVADLVKSITGLGDSASTAADRMAEAAKKMDDRVRNRFLAGEGDASRSMEVTFEQAMQAARFRDPGAAARSRRLKQTKNVKTRIGGKLDVVPITLDNEFNRSINAAKARMNELAKSIKENVKLGTDSLEGFTEEALKDASELEKLFKMLDEARDISGVEGKLPRDFSYADRLRSSVERMFNVEAADIGSLDITKGPMRPEVLGDLISLFRKYRDAIPLTEQEKLGDVTDQTSAKIEKLRKRYDKLFDSSEKVQGKTKEQEKARRSLLEAIDKEAGGLQTLIKVQDQQIAGLEKLQGINQPLSADFFDKMEAVGREGGLKDLQESTQLTSEQMRFLAQNTAIFDRVLKAIAADKTMGEIQLDVEEIMNGMAVLANLRAPFEGWAADAATLEAALQSNADTLEQMRATLEDIGKTRQTLQLQRFQEVADLAASEQKKYPESQGALLDLVQAEADLRDFKQVASDTSLKNFDDSVKKSIQSLQQMAVLLEDAKANASTPAQLEEAEKALQSLKNVASQLGANIGTSGLEGSEQILKDAGEQLKVTAGETGTILGSALANAFNAAVAAVEAKIGALGSNFVPGAETTSFGPAGPATAGPGQPLTASQRAQVDELTGIVRGLNSELKKTGETFIENSAKATQFNTAAGTALKQAGNSAKNAANDMQQFFESAFGSLEDALVGFVTTGKLDFKSLINSIIADLARMVIRMLIIKPLMGFFGGIFGFSGGGIVPGFKNGGVIPAYAPGGIVSGFGGARSDNQLAALSPGEMVINAGSTKQNLGALEYINKTGKMPPSGGGGGSTVFAPSIVINQEGNDPEVTAQMVDAAVRRSWTELAVKSQRKGGVFDRRNG